MSDPTGGGYTDNPLGAFLQGGVQGFQLVEGIRRQRKHDRLADELLALRALTEARQARAAESHARYWDAETGLAQEKANVERSAIETRDRLRKEAAQGLLAQQGGAAATQSLGFPVQAKDVPLRWSPEAQQARDTGRALAGSHGVSVSDPTAIEFGADPTLASRLGSTPRPPTPRAPTLRPGEDASGPGYFRFPDTGPAERVPGVRPPPPRPTSSGTARPPITIDAALRQIDRFFTVPDPNSEDPLHPKWISKLSPGKRYELAQKMARGEAGVEDFDAISDDRGGVTAIRGGTGGMGPAAGTPTAAPVMDPSDTMPARGGLSANDRAAAWDIIEEADSDEEAKARMKDELNFSDAEVEAAMAGGPAAPATPAPAQSVPQAVGKELARDTTPKAAPAAVSPRIQQARATLARYGDLSAADRMQALQKLSYTPQEIRAILAP